MRLGGSKGLLTLMSAAEQEEYKGKHVVLRHSMVKSFPHPEFASDPSLFVLDILKADPIKVGANLSSEPLIVMEHNGVPRDTICSLAQRTLNELRDTFRPTPHDGETAHDVAERLIASTWRWGGVGSDRKRREAAAKGRSAKVTGLIGGHQGVDEEERSEEIGLAEK
jgi:hypothetical protein